jgi:peroxiredoxin
MPILEVGSRAPEFELPTSQGQMATISQLRGDREYLILAFFPKARTSVCGAELAMLDEFRHELEDMGAVVVALSVDPVEELTSWAQEAGFSIPLLSDADPKGAVAESYGVMNPSGVSERALFIVDASDTIVYSYLSPMKENPGVDRLLRALEEMEEEG